MISVSKARNILGRDAESLSDEQIEELLRECQTWAEMFGEQQTQKTPQVIDNDTKNTNIKLRS